MTFYNVISGLLFLATCQVFAGLLGTPSVWVAALLVITILNESVLTSELIERDDNKKVEYTLPLKLLDCVTFVLFLWALLVLSPEQNTLEHDVSKTLWGAGKPWFFWLLLTGYWAVTLVWNYVAKQCDAKKWQGWFLIVMHLMWIPPLVSLFLTRNTPDFSAQSIRIAQVNMLLTLAYLLSKTMAAKK